MIPRLLKQEEKVISLPGLSTDHLFICVLILTKFQLEEVLTAGDLKKVLSKGVALGKDIFGSCSLTPHSHQKKNKTLLLSRYLLYSLNC